MVNSTRHSQSQRDERLTDDFYSSKIYVCARRTVQDRRDFCGVGNNVVWIEGIP